MRFKIIHDTEYLFDSEVFLEPHYFRFLPRKTAYAHIESSSITILSEPVGHRVIRDEENNLVDFCWFEGMTNQLSIKSETIVETIPYNPFDFILHDESFNHLPFHYEKQQKKLLFSTLEKQNISEELINYGADIQAASGYNTLKFLINLTNKLHRDFTVEYRHEGSPLLPADTFDLKRGSCRDLSWMQINLLRYQGFAARFVSGYYYFDMENPAYELHAWVEVFLPGTGWLGLDPSHGILTGNTHFPIASSAYSENTLPVSGGIRGSATSQLVTQLSIEVI